MGETIRIKDLPEKQSLSSDDLFVNSDTITTTKVTAGQIADYVAQSDEIGSVVVKKEDVGQPLGVAPLDAGGRIDGTYITYGTADFTAFPGSEGKKLKENKVDKIEGKGLSSNDFTDEEKSKLAGIAAEANKYTHPDTHPAGMIHQDAEHRFVTDAEKDEWNATLTTANSYSDINYQQATGYTDAKIAALINGAPTTLDTLKEIADAMEENQNVVAALEEAIGSKSNESEFDSHVNNKSNPHEVTKEQVGLENVANERQYSASNPQPSVAGSSGSCTGNAATATKLAYARTIDGVSFNGSAGITHYGTCSTAAATAAKTVAVHNFDLATGSNVEVKFTVTNTAANPTLNVNSTGAKPIYYHGEAISAEYLAANRTYRFVYNGTQWELIGDINTNTSYTTATADKDGLMSSSDKNKLDGLGTAAAYDVISKGATENSEIYGKIPMIDNTGIMEVGKYIDFHNGVLEDFNYTTRINALGDGSGFEILGNNGAQGKIMAARFQGKADNASSADKFYTARTIDGVSFNGSADITHYGTCSTAAATAGKTVDLTGFTLATGADVEVKFTVTNTAANPTLNVNGTGAKPIYYRGAAISAGYLAANRTYRFVYNGTQWELIGDINTNTTYSNFVKSGTGAKAGLVPAPPATAGTTKYLREDGNWAVPPDTNTVYTHPTTSGNKHIPAGGSAGQILRWSSDGTAVWGNDNNTTYTPASAEPKAAGNAAVGTSTKYAREDHVHPLQTSVSGNAGTATKLTTSRAIVIGNASKTFNGSANIAYSLDEIGAANRDIYADTYVSLGRTAGSTVGSLSVVLGGTTNTASGDFSACIGGANNKSSGINSTCDGGLYNTASGSYSACIGGDHNSTGLGSYAVCIGGQNNSSSGESSVVIGGQNNRVTKIGSVAIGGVHNYSSSPYGYSLGYYNSASNFAEVVIGKYANYSKTTTNAEASNQLGTVFMIGNGYSATSPGGTTETRSNAMRVNYDGSIYGTKAYTSSGADYAEFIYEWEDGNEDMEDRVGYFVTVKNQKLYKATGSDYIAGITSGNPSVVGNGDEDYYWKYERDEFNRFIWEDVEEEVQAFDEESGEPLTDEETGTPIMEKTGNIIPKGRMKISKNYNPDVPYIERKDRKEWDYVGMLGVLPVRDDGTCLVGQYCKCNDDGTATLATSEEIITNRFTYMVIERISSNVVKVILK